MRSLLRPGTHLLRRADGSLQIGLDPERAVVVPDSPELRHSLLGAGRPASADVAGLIDLLETQDLLVDERVLMPLIGDSDQSPLATRDAGAALVRAAGHHASDRVAARLQARVSVAGFGHDAGAGLVASLRELLERSALRPPETGTPTSTPASTRATPSVAGTPLVGALVGVGEPDRELLDPWTREHVPLLLVRLTEGRAVLGPFVVPGRTACLRCIDAHHTDADGDWPLLVRQYAAASSGDRADGAPEPVDPALATLAVAWAARDIATYVDGQRPSTWSTTLIFDGSLAAVEARSWLRHPECGCSWA